MTIASHLRGMLDTLNAAHPWSHNEAYSGFVLRQARRARRDGGTAALDVGCGSGVLLRRLGSIFPRVVGIEADAHAATSARRLSSETPSVTVVNASFPADAETFDFVSVVAVLHHLPPRSGVEMVRATLAPGGRLVIVGLHRETPADLPLSLISLVLNPLVGLLRDRGRTSSAHKGVDVPTTPATHSYAEIKRALRAAMPGISVRRGLFWRYIAVWHCDDAVRASQHGVVVRPPEGRC